MGKILGAYITPHPPIMIEEIGGRDSSKVSDTIKALQKVSKKIKEQGPDTIIIITPHGTMFGDAMTFSMEDKLTGSFGRFGAPGLKYEFVNDVELAEIIMEEADKEEVFCLPFTREMAETYNSDMELDHGALVPLHFIEKENKNVKLVHITYSGLPDEDHYKLGMGIKRGIHKSNSNAVIIASGDFSHRLIPGAPAGYDKRGKEYDSLFLDIIKRGNVSEFLNIDKSLISAAGECAYKSALVLLGAFDKCEVTGEVYSYEGPFGVGYGVAELTTTQCDRGASIIDEYLKGKNEEMDALREKEDPYVKLARATLENKVRHGKDTAVPVDLPEEMLKRKAGVFVSLKKDGDLRGCIGTIMPTTRSVAHEIVQNALSAGLRDPRFLPVTEDELEDLVYSVDVLGEAEEISSKEDLDPNRYGVIVRKGGRTGLLLPNLEGVDSVDEQLSITLRKAGIREWENYSMERFEVIRHV